MIGAGVGLITLCAHEGLNRAGISSVRRIPRACAQFSRVSDNSGVRIVPIPRSLDDIHNGLATGVPALPLLEGALSVEGLCTLEVAQLLIASGAKVEGELDLVRYAAANSSADVVDLLVHRGADAHTNACLALSQATQANRPEIWFSYEENVCPSESASP